MSSATSLKEELFKLKNRLETIEEQLTSQSNEIDMREGKWERIEKNLSYILSTQGDRIKINVGGKLFTTSTSTILSIRDSFLARLVESGKIDLKQEIFFDRSPNVFHIILDYYRYKKIDYKKLNKEQIIQLYDDAEYFAIGDIADYLAEKLKEPTIIAVETAGDYVYQGKVVGTNKFSDLNSSELTTGVCSTTPGKITVEINSDYEFGSLEIAGFNGDTKAWYPDNGSGAKIFSSLDKINWTHVGQIPSGFGKTIKNCKLTKVTNGKYLKFECNTYLGIGYLKVNKVDNFKFS